MLFPFLCPSLPYQFLVHGTRSSTLGIISWGCKNLAAHCIFLAVDYSSQLLACFCISYKMSEEAHLPLQKAASCRFQRKTGRKEGNPLFSLWNGAALHVSLCELGQHITEWLQFFKTGYHSDRCEWVEVGKEEENKRLEFITLSITE